MTVMAPSVEEILEKLVHIARGNPALVQEALGRAAAQGGRAATLEEVVTYILSHRTDVPQRS